MGWQNSVGWVLFSLIICLPVHHWRARPGLFQTFQNQSWHLCLENELKIISSPSLISSHRESKTDFLKNHDHKLLYLLMQYFVLFGFLLECYRCIVSTLRRNTFKGCFSLSGCLWTQNTICQILLSDANNNLVLWFPTNISFIISSLMQVKNSVLYIKNIRIKFKMFLKLNKNSFYIPLILEVVKRYIGFYC